MTDQSPESYKISVHCKREDRESIEAIFEDALFPAPFSLASFEATPDGENWCIEAWFLDMPDKGECAQLFGAWEWSISPVLQQNWVERSLRPLDPVVAGRFYVYGSHDGPDAAPQDKIALKIDAGMAFGTGHHETTSGCLEAISLLHKSINPRNILDLGCGTGLLGIGAAKLWRDAALTLSDIDPDATNFTRASVVDNGLNGKPGLAIITANGLIHPGLKARAPYDLIIANILAAPLVRLAPALCHSLSGQSHDRLVLSGLLVKQEQMVLSAYLPFGLTVSHRIRQGEWSCLVLSRK